MSYPELHSKVQLNKFPEILSVQDLQKALTIGRSKAYHLIRSGNIKHWKIGKSIKIPKVYVVEYIENSCYTGRVVMDSSSQEGG